jgi:hypothetical protein
MHKKGLRNVFSRNLKKMLYGFAVLCFFLVAVGIFELPVDIERLTAFSELSIILDEDGFSNLESFIVFSFTGILIVGVFIYIFPQLNFRNVFSRVIYHTGRSIRAISISSTQVLVAFFGSLLVGVILSNLGVWSSVSDVIFSQQIDYLGIENTKTSRAQFVALFFSTFFFVRGFIPLRYYYLFDFEGGHSRRY